MKIIKSIALSALFFMPPLWAGQCLTNEGAKTYFIFANGMFNNYKDAQVSSEKLKNKVKSIAYNASKPSISSDDLDNIGFDLSYNNSGQNLLEQALEALEAVHQRGTMEHSQGLREITLWSRGNGKLPEVMKNHQEEFQGVITAYRYNTDKDLQNHVAKYDTLLKQGNRVIVVGHSQGSMYGNEAYDVLEETSSTEGLELIAVGTPLPEVRGSGYYITDESDPVMNGIVPQYYPSTLPANVENSDLKGHSFASYIGGDVSGELLEEYLLHAYQNTPYPQAQINSGVIDVALSWGNEPDMDLHIKEPSGVHVYYQNSRGYSGYLDRDDTDGRGPEHYFADCSDLETGVYTVGVNYFHGEGAETAKVNIKAGSKSAIYTERFTQAKGADGNNSYRVVAIIDVSLTSDGRYKFRILRK